MQQRAIVRSLAAAAVTALVAGVLTATVDTSRAASAPAAEPRGSQRYLVLTADPAGASAVAAELRRQGAEVTSVNTDVGLVSATSTDAAFRGKAGRVAGVRGVAAERVVGRAPDDRAKVAPKADTPQPPARQGRTQVKKAAAGDDPLDGYLWGLRMIKADQAHTKTLGKRQVKVGVMDTGIQGDHPDLHANFDARASRNFTTDIPTDSAGNVVDGPCEVANCIDPADVDDDGHGTHVAGTIAAAANGFGLTGVAPKVRLVNVRAGQDSGYFFAGPTVNALTYAGDAGLDVVNMSFYVDPWLYNCRGGAPEDNPEEAQDQEVILESVTRALNYAHRKGVTLVGSSGNSHLDMATPGVDESSPDFPADAAHTRTIDDATCKNLPAEGPHVLGIDALGPSGKKADYSNWTTKPRSGEVEFAAPGGWYRDFFGTDQHRVNNNLILSTAPLKVLQASGEVDADGNITPDGETTGVIKQCQSDPAPGTSACGYYQWLQGTSMASPHATGVAALAVSAHGRSTRDGFGWSPDKVAALMSRTAIDHTCPAGGVQSYLQEGRDDTYTARCVGTTARNGFYGEGIVNAYGVVK